MCFFSSRRRHTRFDCDWSSDVCSSDLGVPLTMVLAAVFAGLLLGMSSKAALMLGAILVVSGPTVVGPLLLFIRPTERLQRVLSWEGSLIDPVGGILGAAVFQL